MISQRQHVKVVIEFEPATVRGETVQQAVDSVVDGVGRFNRDKVPFYLEAYNEEMAARNVDETFRLEFFCRMVAVWVHEEVKGLREAHSS